MRDLLRLRLRARPRQLLRLSPFQPAPLLDGERLDLAPPPLQVHLLLVQLGPHLRLGLREGLTPDEARELQKLKGKVPLLQNASEQEMVMNRIAQLEAKAKIPPGLSPEEDAELARLKAKLGQLERAERGLLIDRIAELERKSLIPPGLTPEEQAELARLKTRLSEVDEKDELKNRIGELQAKAKIPPGLSAEEEAELTRLRGRMAALNGMGASDSYSLARDAAEKAAEADAARARLNELQRKWADGTITPDELEEVSPTPTAPQPPNTCHPLIP